MIKFELPAALRDSLAAARLLAGGAGGPDDAAARAADPVIGQHRPRVEALEPRLLLTRLSGGGIINGQVVDEVFEFQAPNTVVRVVLSGNIEVELIGASQDVFGNPRLNPIPGVIDAGPRAGTNLFGGFQGANGIEPVSVAFPGETSAFTDLTDRAPGGAGGGRTAPSDDITLSALATNADGKTYALNFFEQEAGAGGGDAINRVQLVSLDRSNGDGTIVRDLAPRMARLAGTGDPADVDDVIAADFSPANPNLLYFVANVGIPQGDDTNVVPLLYTYNLANDRLTVARNNGNPNGGLFSFGSTADTPAEVFGITFNSQNQLVTFLTSPQSQGRGGDTAEVGVTGFTTILDPAAPNLDSGGIIAANIDGGDTVDAVNGIEVLPDSDQFVTAVVDTDLVRFDLATGNGITLGALPDPRQEGSTRQRGASIEGITYHPTIPNPFLLTDGDPTNDNDRGALIGTDTDTDELVFLDARDRFPETDLYSVIVIDGDETGNIAIAAVADRDAVGPRPMLPYAGAVESLRVTNANGGPLIDVSPEAGTGAVLLGLLLGGDEVNDEISGTPILSIPSNTYTERTFGYTLPTNLQPGVRAQADIGKFLFGGTITGRVDSSGSIGTFYAGQILTGDATGLGATEESTNIDNFAVRGDLRNLFSFGSIGTIGTDLLRPEYRTGFQLAVGGDVGQVVTRGQFAGTGGVLGEQAGVSKIVDGQAELEVKLNQFVPFPGDGFQEFLLQDPRFYNDTFDTPQYVNTFRTDFRNFDGQATLYGNLNNTPDPAPLDGVDYFAAGLLAGQTVELELLSGGSNVGVFDPDGNLIATDYTASGGPFRFTAETPGAYRFAVALSGDPNFDGNGAPLGTDTYELRLSNLGRIAWGGLVTGDILNTDSVPLRVFGGDFGAIAAAGEFESRSGTRVDRGNLRSVVAEEIGRTASFTDGGGTDGGTGGGTGGDDTGGTFSINFSDGGTLVVPRGVVGLLRSTDAEGVLALNPLLTSDGLLQGDVAQAAVNGYQVIDSANVLAGSYVAKGGIGSARGRYIGGATLETSFIADADDFGNDGTIDLIDASQDIGSLRFGGPILSTGAGGNVRYMRAGRTIYSDRSFGGGTQQQTQFDPGQSVTLTDDSGTEITFTPTLTTRNGGGTGTQDPGAGGTTPTNENPNVNPGVGTTVPFDPTGGGTTPTNENPSVDPRNPNGVGGGAAPGTNGGTASPDSGGTTPTNENPSVDPRNPGTGTNGTILPGLPGSPGFGVGNVEQLTIATYPVRGSGGSVILNVTSTGGIDIVSDGNAGSSVEISQLTLNGLGTTVAEVATILGRQDVSNGQVDVRFARANDTLVVPNTRGDLAAMTRTGLIGTGPTGSVNEDTDSDLTFVTPFDGLFPAAGTPPTASAGDNTPLPQLDATFSGGSRIDVLRLAGGAFSNITNDTGGEFGTIEAGTIGTLRATTVGAVVPRGSRAAVRPLALVEGGGSATAFPFLNNTTGIVATRVAEVRADTVGDLVIRGDVGTIRANSFSARQRGRFDGIAGAVYVGGNVGSVDIGRGILSSGSGDAGDAGIYATGVIGSVTNRGLGSDVRGNIISNSGIGSVVLNDGALIDASVRVIGNLSDSRRFIAGTTLPGLQTTINQVQPDIREVRVSGSGGILGSMIQGLNIGPVSSTGGFGILGSLISSTGNGTIQSVEADGLGIRGTFIDSGARVGSIVANGDGNLLDVNRFTPSVRGSAAESFDANTGSQFDPTTNDSISESSDLLTYLNIDGSQGRVSGVTNSGIIENLVAQGTRDLGRISGYQISSDPNRPTASGSGFRNPAFTSRLSFGNSIGSVRTGGSIVGLEITTGGLNEVSIGGTLFAADWRIAGELASLRVGGSIVDGVGLGGGTTIRATGPNGRIGRIGANGDILGDISASTRIDEIAAGRDLGTRRLFSDGPIGRLTVGRDVLTGTRVQSNGPIGMLFVGDDVERGSIIRATSFGRQQIGGSVNGAIVTA